MLAKNIEEMIHMMRQAGAPESLIPKIRQRLENNKNVRNWHEEQQKMSEIAKKREETWREKHEREQFSVWLLFLLTILNSKEKDCTTWLHSSFRQMADLRRRPHPILGEQPFIERSFAAVSLVKWSRKTVTESMLYGVPSFENTQDFNRGKVTSTFPMTHALDAIKAADEEAAAREAAKQEPAPEPSNSSKNKQ